MKSIEVQTLGAASRLATTTQIRSVHDQPIVLVRLTKQILSLKRLPLDQVIKLIPSRKKLPLELPHELTTKSILSRERLSLELPLELATKSIPSRERLLLELPQELTTKPILSRERLPLELPLEVATKPIPSRKRLPLEVATKLILSRSMILNLANLSVSCSIDY